MYDTFYMLGVDAERIRCAAGHAQTGDLQSKTLDCSLHTYFVYGGMLYGYGKTIESEPRLEGGHLITSSIVSHRPIALSAVVEVHSFCEQCDPVCYESTTMKMFGGDALDEMSPWVEWNLHFENGRLTRAESVRIEVRDDVRKKIRELGYNPIPDDAMIAKLHVQQWRKDRA